MELFAKTCSSTSGCHMSMDPAQGLDLASPGVAARLVGVAPTGPGCTGVLADPKNPTQSVLYRKLTDSPPCGVPMPFGGNRVSAADLACVKTWIASLSAGDSGAADSAPPKDASIHDVFVFPDSAPPPPVDAGHEAAVVPEAAPPLGTGLKGQYFDNDDYTNLKLTRTDPTIDFVWTTTQSPDASITTDGMYSAKWTGNVTPEFGETYTFYADSDDGVHVIVNGQDLFNDMTGHATMTFTGTVTLEAGKSYPIELDWFNSGGPGEIHLSWSSASRAKQIVPKDRLTPAP
jgi:hypothetical protein